MLRVSVTRSKHFFPVSSKHIGKTLPGELNISESKSKARPGQAFQEGFINPSDSRGQLGDL